MCVNRMKREKYIYEYGLVECLIDELFSDFRMNVKLNLYRTQNITSNTSKQLFYSQNSDQCVNEDNFDK